MSRLFGSVPQLPAESGERYPWELILFRAVMAVVDSSLEPNRLLDLALRTVLETLGPGVHGVVFLLTPDGRRLEAVAQQGVLPEGASFEITLGEGICSQVARGGAPVFEPVCSGHGCEIDAWIKTEHGHLVFPLRARQKVIGVFCVLCPPDSLLWAWNK